MKTRISTHVCNDDSRQWKFERSSNLPRDYFGRRIRLTADCYVFIALLLAGVALYFIPA